MAGSSFFALLDDIASLLDDIAAMSKVAVKKTAGVLGDDLALNAQQVAGVATNREIPVVWAVAKGSLVNKAILVPLALLISWLAPWAVKPLLMIGGAYLCFEGVEKVLHKLLHRYEKHEGDDPQTPEIETKPMSETEIEAMEKQRIWTAIRTDFILSAEIIVISLGVFAQETLLKQLGAFVIISLAMTVGVYGLVAGIVKLDDLGLHWLNSKSKALQQTGRGLLWFAPLLLRFLSFAGTTAMFLVGGEIILHGIKPVYDQVHHWSEAIHHWPTIGWLASFLFELVCALVVGLLAGLVVLGAVKIFSAVWPGKKKQGHH
jgi:predicted DNA repair protein MutK